VQGGLRYQGQKCSACSRAIVSEKIYDTFVQKLVERTKKITVGPSDDPNNYMGPVVSQSAMKTILDYIEIGKKEGKLLTGGRRAAGDGYFIEPTIIADVDPKARLAQEEVFGPVLAVIKAKNYDPGVGNRQQYGVWVDGRGVLEESGEDKKGRGGVSCRQSLSESEMHWSDGWRAPVWRVQHVRTDSKAGGKDICCCSCKGNRSRKK